LTENCNLVWLYFTGGLQYNLLPLLHLAGKYKINVEVLIDDKLDFVEK
jgi:hypothetical protein